jgi:hypothetical protein
MKKRRGAGIVAGSPLLSDHPSSSHPGYPRSPSLRIIQMRRPRRSSAGCTLSPNSSRSIAATSATVRSPSRARQAALPTSSNRIRLADILWKKRSRTPRSPRVLGRGLKTMALPSTSSQSASRNGARPRRLVPSRSFSLFFPPIPHSDSRRHAGRDVPRAVIRPRDGGNLPWFLVLQMRRGQSTFLHLAHRQPDQHVQDQGIGNEAQEEAGVLQEGQALEEEDPGIEIPSDNQ